MVLDVVASLDLRLFVGGRSWWGGRAPIDPGMLFAVLI